MLLWIIVTSRLICRISSAKLDPLINTMHVPLYLQSHPPKAIRKLDIPRSDSRAYLSLDVFQFCPNPNKHPHRIGVTPYMYVFMYQTLFVSHTCPGGTVTRQREEEAPKGQVFDVPWLK